MRGSLILRTAVVAFGGLVLGAGLVALASGSMPGFVLLQHKDEILSAYEKNGIDTSDCRKRKVSVREPTGGMPDCLESSMRDIARKLNEGTSE